ncbi:hypothetical protein ACJRO7_035583 [Eucalyptus globulus]|uniref:Uncharacterized protein n=1 Tax=Eucalyptus globulus TaxID=34317 RepID=A0ABD3J9Z0_EUCGL
MGAKKIWSFETVASQITRKSSVKSIWVTLECLSCLDAKEVSAIIKQGRPRKSRHKTGQMTAFSSCFSCELLRKKSILREKTELGVEEMGESGDSIYWFKTFFSCFLAPAKAASSRPEKPSKVEATVVESCKHFSSAHKVQFS